MKEFKPPYYKLIKIDGYRYVVDKTAKKNGKKDYTICKAAATGKYHLEAPHWQPWEGLETDPDYSKVIATNNPDLPNLLWLPEPDGQEDLIEECRKYMNSLVFNRKGSAISPEAVALAAKLNKAKGKGTYSEDDMRKIAIEFGNTLNKNKYDSHGDGNWTGLDFPFTTEEAFDGNFNFQNEYFKSLKPEPIGVKLNINTVTSPTKPNQYIPTSFLNKEGRQLVIVENWIYE
jgi:hypothetical protein